MSRKRVAIYARVSTDEQTTQNQLNDLTEVADRLEWDIVKVFKDDGISGAKGRDKRPGFDALMKGVTRKEFDLVAAWSVCRIGRSLPDLISFMTEVNDRGIGLYLHKQGLDSTSPSGRLMFNLLSVFSEYERAMISDRVKSGIARKRMADENHRHGRPPICQKKVREIQAALAAGYGIHKTAKQIGVGVGTVQKIKKQMLEPDGGGHNLVTAS